MAVYQLGWPIRRFCLGSTNLPPYSPYGGIFVRDRNTGTTKYASISNTGVPANSSCSMPVISANGRFVAFITQATNLVPADNNIAGYGVYIRDLVNGVTEKISISFNGTNQNGTITSNLAISADGRFIAFASTAYNLVPLDNNGGAGDIFVRDRLLQTTEIVSGNMNDGYTSGSPSMSYDGRYIAYSRQQDGQVYIYDRQTRTAKAVSVNKRGELGNNASGSPSISSDGRYVAFESYAGNLAWGDNTAGSGYPQVYCHDTLGGYTWAVSVDASGNRGPYSSQAPVINANGMFIAFDSWNVLAPGGTYGNTDLYVHNSGVDSDGDGFIEAAEGNDYNSNIYPGATEIKSDGIDQDCNGYDLTINITSAVYTKSTKVLSIIAKSNLGSQANLTAINYGAMTWNKNNSTWTKSVSVSTAPTNVAVSGIEGATSTLVTVK